MRTTPNINKGLALAPGPDPVNVTHAPKVQAATPLDPVYLALIEQVHQSSNRNILRLPASARKMGRANSTYWADIKNGLAPTAVRIGDRSVGWLSEELDAILAARSLASRNNIPLDIKKFVALLVAPRMPVSYVSTIPKENKNA